MDVSVRVFVNGVLEEEEVDVVKGCEYDDVVS